MLTLLLCAQLAAVATAPNDSIYSSAALRELVARAAQENLHPPPGFQSYKSRIETELSLLIRDTLGREHTAQIEQFATRAEWTRDGRYDLHVIGYRSQSAGVPYSALSIVQGWTVPSLYGNRLALGAYFNSRRRRADTLTAVHPFAQDRDGYYRFTGGDTVTVLRVGGRSIPIARIHVHPSFTGTTRLAAFEGEIDLDADRAQIVRMRGQFVTLGDNPGLRRRLLQAVTGVVAVAYAEFVNAEVDGKYWLPAFQRTEFQAGFRLSGADRPVFRLVSNIDDIVVADSASSALDSVPPTRLRLTWAPTDSVSRYGAWQRALGTQSGSVHSDDFADLAPDVWRPTGAPRLNVFPNNTAKLFRFNRVEGAFTGVAPSVDFRDVAPGLSVGGNVGWAWTEQTVRGGAFASYRVGSTTYGARAERVLATSNTFLRPRSDDPGLGALIGSFDPYNYLDRKSAIASVTRVFGGLDVGLLTLQAGAATDRSEQTRIAHGLFSRQAFRANPTVTEGSYALGMADLEIHPNVTGDFVQPGVGLRAHYEVGSGQLNWQRAELGLSSRYYLGPISLVAHADGGAVFGSSQLPTQRTFRLGGDGTLPGYTVDQFQGDYAALFRSFASYRFGVWKRPIHVWRTLFIPGVGPGLAVSAQGGWTAFSSANQTAANAALVTNGIRATVGGGITLFSDALHLGLARPLDHPAPWRFVGGFGVSF